MSENLNDALDTVRNELLIRGGMITEARLATICKRCMVLPSEVKVYLRAMGAKERQGAVGSWLIIVPFYQNVHRQTPEGEAA